MKSFTTPIIIASALGASLTLSTAASASGWERIDLKGSYTIELPDGDGGTVSRTLEPVLTT